MTRENWSSSLYHVTEYIMRLAYLNLLWLGFTILGGVVLGWSPATVAMHHVMRKWIVDQEYTKVFSSFWRIYRSEFIKSQKIGIILTIIGILLIIDLKFFIFGESAVFLGKLFAVQLSIAYFVVCSYIFSIYTCYEMDCLKMIKTAFMLGLMHPMRTLFMLMGLFALIIMFLAIPSLTIFFGGSLLTLLGTYNSHKLLNYNDSSSISRNPEATS